MTLPNDVAYPRSIDQHSGLTKRELIAAMTLQGICAGNSVNEKESPRLSIKLADMLIEELNK